MIDDRELQDVQTIKPLCEEIRLACAEYVDVLTVEQDWRGARLLVKDGPRRLSITIRWEQGARQ